MDIHLGIPETQRKAIADGLSRLLADTYSLYLQTHNFHWNVSGPMFNSLHLMFETQYTELALAVDLIAERIRALGFPAPGTYSAFAKLSSVDEIEGVPAARDMIVDAWRASVGMGVGYPMIAVRDIESGRRILTRDDFGRD